MIRGVAYSKKLSVLCAIGIGAALTTVWIRYQLTSDWLEQMSRAAESEGVLIKQIATMSDYNDSNLRALRLQIGRFRGQLGQEDLWKCLVLQFGKDWTSKVGPKEERTGYSFQIGTFIRVSPSASDWPRIVEVVKAAEHIPGVGIAGFEMKSSGDREHRSVDVVKVVLAIRSRQPGATL